MLLEALLLQRAVRLLPLLLLQVDGMEVAVARVVEATPELCSTECREKGWWWWQQEDPTRCPEQRDPRTGKAWGGDHTEGQLGEKCGFSIEGDHQWRSFPTNTLFWKDDGAGMDYWWKRTNDAPSRCLGGDKGASGNAEKKCDCDGLHSSSSANPPPNQDDDCQSGWMILWRTCTTAGPPVRRTWWLATTSAISS